MPALSDPATRPERTALIRHAALCLAAGAALLWPLTARTSNEVLWLISLVVLLNLGAAMAFRWMEWTRVAAAFSSLLGLAGWFALGCATGGVRSPFVAGLWLEILLSALCFPCLGTFLVTAGSTAALLGQWLLEGPENSLGTLLLQGAFLGSMGGVTVLVTCRWQSAQRDLARHEAELQRGLATLEEELETARRMGQVGESAALFAHGMKNALHALRGYTALLQEKGEVPVRLRAVEGMRACLDRLEETSRLILDSGTASPAAPPGEGLNDTGRSIDAVIREVSVLFPGIRWSRQTEDPLPAVAAPGEVLREALLNLVKNAAEAMDGRGEVIIETRARGGTLEIAVRDQGGGLDETELQRLFMPGHTTKAAGSGFGLFLTRRLLESCGGFVSATSERGRGSFFAIGLPVRRS